MFRKIAWYLLMNFRTIGVLNRCGFYVIQKICKYMDVVLHEYITSDNTTVASYSLNDQQPVLLNTEFYNVAKSIKEIPEVLPKRNVQVIDHDIETSTGRKFRNETELQRNNIQDNESSSFSSPEYKISEMQISPTTVSFNDSDKCITYNLKDAKRVTVAYKLPNNSTNNNLNACFQKHISKPTNAVTKPRGRFDESGGNEKSDTNSDYCKTHLNTRETISKPFFSDLWELNGEKHTELSENGEEAKRVNQPCHLISSKSWNFSRLSESTKLLSENSRISSQPDMKVSTSNPSINVEFTESSENILSKPRYCSESLNKDYSRVRRGYRTTIHSSEKNEHFIEFGSFPTAKLDICLLQNSSSFSSLTGARNCYTCEYLVNTSKSIHGRIPERVDDLRAKIFNFTDSEGNYPNQNSEINTNLKDTNEVYSSTETERSLITHVKELEENQPNSVTNLGQASLLANISKLFKVPEIVQQEISNCCRKISSNNLLNYISEHTASDVNEMKCTSKKFDTRDEKLTESAEIEFNFSSKLNEEIPENKTVHLPSEVEYFKNSPPPVIFKQELHYSNAQNELVEWTTDLKKYSNIHETTMEHCTNTPFSNIRDWNSFNSAPTIEMHPKVAMTHSNRTEMSEDDTENLIKGKESNNQFNKMVQSLLTEVSDDKQIQMPKSLEKDSENTTSNLKVVKSAENETLLQYVPKPNKTLQLEAIIATLEQCISDLKKYCNNRKTLTQHNTNKSCSNIHEWNAFNSAPSTETHPEVAMTHSNRTELSEDDTENLIKKEQESNNQFNKMVQSLSTEVCDTDDKQIRMPNTLEKDAEDTTNNLKVVKSTENESLQQYVTKTNKKLELEAIIARLEERISNLNKDYSNFRETLMQRSTQTPFSNISDCNAFNSAPTIEMYPEVAMTHSNRTELSEGDTENLIKKQESNNQSNKLVQTLSSEVCETDDKQIQMTNTLEKDAEDTANNLKVVKSTENESLQQYVPKTNKKLKHEATNAKLGQCRSDFKKYGNNRKTLTQHNTNTPCSNIHNCNAFNSAPSIEMHPEVGMTHSNKTEISADDTENLIKKEESSNNQFNKMVQSLPTEVCNTGDKQIQMPNTQEKGSENTNNFKEVRRTRNERRPRYVPQTNKKLKHEATIAKLGQCISDFKKYGNNRKTLTQHNTDTTFSNIPDCNALNSAPSIEMHPEVAMTHSNKTKISEGDTENVIKEEESNNQFNKMVQSLSTEMCDTDNKQIQMPNILEKDSENVNGDLKEVKSTENERIMQDFSRNNKKLKHEENIARIKPCVNSEEPSSCLASATLGASLTTGLYECKINYSESSSSLDIASRLSSDMEKDGHVSLEQVESSTRPSVVYLKSDLALKSLEDQTIKEDIPNSKKLHRNVTCSEGNLGISVTPAKTNIALAGNPSTVSQVSLDLKAAFEHKHLEEQAFENRDNTNKKLNEEFLSPKNKKNSNEKSSQTSSNLDKRKLNSESKRASRDNKSKKSKK